MIIDASATDRDKPHVAVLRFWTEYEEVPGKPGAPQEVHWVEYVKKGSNGASTCEKVRRIEKSNPLLWSVLKGSYAAWREGQAEPVDGTPLSAWPGVTPAHADRLKMAHIKTVEDVAAMTDADMDRVGMGARALREKARAFIEAKKGTAAIAEALEQRDRTIADQAAQIAELTETVAKLAENQGMTVRRGPGRPPKQAA